MRQSPGIIGTNAILIVVFTAAALAQPYPSPLHRPVPVPVPAPSPFPTPVPVPRPEVSRKAVPAPTPIIPKDSYGSWSLFLPCNPAWLVPQKAQELADLHRLYVAFGETTGPKHAAVWFHKGTNPSDIDVEQSTIYCEKFKLKRSEGPFIIVTTVHPDASSERPEVVLAFGRLQAGVISNMILTLTDQIATEKLSQDEVNSVQYWQSWIRVIEGACRNLAKTKFSLKVKVLEIERTGLCGDTAS